MFRTEVVQSKNLRRKPIYKVYLVLNVIAFTFIILMLLKLIPEDSGFGKTISENYEKLVQPIVLGVVFVLFMFNGYVKNAVKNPKRIGTLQMNEDEVQFLINDELQETVALKDVKAIHFEFSSFRMRGNPAGCMNYLVLKENNAEKEYEIVITNSMVKSEFAALLAELNKKIPVTVSYTYFLRRIFKDKEFEF